MLLQQIPAYLFAFNCTEMSRCSESMRGTAFPGVSDIPLDRLCVNQKSDNP